MKYLLILIAALALCTGLFAQDGGMMRNNGNGNGNYSFSGTEMLLGAILIVLVVALLVWVLSKRRNRD